ncbi:MAG: hypothetical protein WAS21_01995 [Geminicoccaceae bacterium]
MNIRSTWHRGWAMVLAAKCERDAARLRTRVYGFREPPNLVILKRRLIVAQIAYDDARVALMATAAFEKAGVRWKWKQMEDLIERFSEWELELAADEARFGMGEDRPEIKPPAATDKAAPAPTTAAVLDQIGRILIDIRSVIQPGGPHAS